MRRVEVKLNLEAVAPLLDVIKSAADDIREEFASTVRLPERDKELASTWKDDLMELQQDEIKILLSLFDSDFFLTGVIEFTLDNSELTLRGAAAIRLRLREKYLREVEDETLESGEIQLERLPLATQRAFAAYVFLASLQEVIIQHLDPTQME